MSAGINVFPWVESFKYPQKYHLLTNMRAKKFTRKIKVSLDEETYKQAKELADALTYGNVSELVRQLIKIAYNNERGGKA